MRRSRTNDDDYVWLGNSYTAYVDDLEDDDDQPMYGATVTWTMYAEDRLTELGTGPLTAAEDVNDYEGTVAPAVFENQPADSAVWVKYTATADNRTATWWEQLTVGYRRG